MPAACIEVCTRGFKSALLEGKGGKDTHPISSTEYPIRTSARKVMRNCAELDARIAATGGDAAVSTTAGMVRESTSWCASAVEMLDRSWQAAATVTIPPVRHGTWGGGALTVDFRPPGRVVGGWNGNADYWQVWSGCGTLVEELADGRDAMGVGRIEALGVVQCRNEVAQPRGLRGGCRR